MQHNFIIANADTDAISFCKPDMTVFTRPEIDALVKEINDLTNEFMVWEDDGYYDRFIVLAAKNYIMLDEKGKLTLKGSGLKDAKLEPIFKLFFKEIIDSLLNDREDFTAIYHKYIKMASNITDIKPWCSKKTISATTYTSVAPAVMKIHKTIQGTDYVEGDRIYVFFDEDYDSMVLLENFKGTYSKQRLYEKLYKATERFSVVIDQNLFVNYGLVRNKKKLEELLNV